MATPIQEKETFILCKNSQGMPVRGSSLRLTRYIIAFEVYNPYSILQLSEVLNDFQIHLNNHLVYSGRAVVSSLVNTGIILVCEATLEDGWLDVDLFNPSYAGDRIRSEFEGFLLEWKKLQVVAPDFKILVADMHTLLADLRRWLEQVELGIRSSGNSSDRNKIERDVIHELGGLILPTVEDIFVRFEGLAEGIEAPLQPLHRAYARRQLHPLTLCSPFFWRTFTKPLGYAGDYEMVNMILRDPIEGASLFAKLLNMHFLRLPAGEAHRNRVIYLRDCLRGETQRCAARGQPARIFNLGCGPAKEVQSFLTEDDLCDRAHLTLLDFNEETIQNTGHALGNLRAHLGRRTQIRMLQRSVHQILKDGPEPGAAPGTVYDFIYCAGLFDYLSDRICKRLVEIFYDLLAPDGLLVVTNVDLKNPSRHMMEYLMEWHLIYRTADQLGRLAPAKADPSRCQVRSDSTGVNIFLEIRKPAA
ncbi:MAG: class I SAM-dependent methyltransferase [Candidatus Methylacidiphilales bacterium]|nr:class I SAM-dependent methyltransferase [Candidatus Methylacidiphilales bacterium]